MMKLLGRWFSGGAGGAGSAGSVGSRKRKATKPRGSGQSERTGAVIVVRNKPDRMLGRVTPKESGTRGMAGRCIL